MIFFLKQSKFFFGWGVNYIFSLSFFPVFFFGRGSKNFFFAGSTFFLVFCCQHFFWRGSKHDYRSYHQDGLFLPNNHRSYGQNVFISFDDYFLPAMRVSLCLSLSSLIILIKDIYTCPKAFKGVVSTTLFLKLYLYFTKQRIKLLHQQLYLSN